MTDEREAFHAAIWQTPDDDLPRLVYADWLDERGEHDEAAFLRLLCCMPCATGGGSRSVG
ncbi:MAG: TIGR02996 domain-containing protein [Fimbriiglobus sp.]|nr:TIGR02996 domain-containing protein [Fimbriiglobus sp.]